MLKTYVSVATIGKAPEIVKGFIDKNGWPISTIITKPDSVRIYFSYKWYQYYNVYMVKQEVKRHYKPNRFKKLNKFYVDDFTKKTALSSEQCKKELEEFADTIDIQGGIRCRNVEAIVNKDGTIIGYKK